MAANNPTVIDLVSSDDDDAPSPRARKPTRAPAHHAGPGSAPGPAPRPTPSPAPAAYPPAAALDDIDAVSDAEAEDDVFNLDDFLELPGRYPDDDDQMPAVAPRGPTSRPQGEIIVIDGEDVFIPDSPRAMAPVATNPLRQEALEQEAAYARDSENFTADLCLTRVLNMFPDIDHQHVITLYNAYDDQGAEALPGGARLEAIVEKLLSGEAYPRQTKPPQLKRKREEDATDQDSKRWEGPGREAAPPAFKKPMIAILKAEFPEIPKDAIAKELARRHHLFPTYLSLADMKDTSGVNKKWSGRPLKDVTSADSLATNCGWVEMPEELEAARKHVKDIRRKRVIEDAKKWAEAENLQKAIDAGETAECQACFDDLPMNR